MTWISSGDGLWSESASWSTGLSPINGQPAVGDTYDVTLGSGFSFYEVGVDVETTVDSLTLDSPLANLRLDGSGSLRALNGIDLGSSVLYLNGGSLRDTRLSGNGIGGVRIDQAGQAVELDNVTLATRLDVSTGNRLTSVMNGLTLDGGVVNLLSPLSTRWTFTGSQTVSGNGQINTNRVVWAIDESLEIGEGITINAGGFSSAIAHDDAGPIAVTNRGTINVASGSSYGVTAASLSELGQFTNKGTLDVAGRLIITRSQFANTGVIRLRDGGILDVGGRYSIADLGQIDRDTANGGTINLSGDIAADNGVIDLGLLGGSVNYTAQNESAVIRAGTQGVSSIGYLSDASTLQGDFATRGASLFGTVTLDNATLEGIAGNFPAELDAKGDTSSLVGTGTIRGDIALTSDGQFTIGSGITLRADHGNTIAIGGQTYGNTIFQGNAIIDHADSQLVLYQRLQNQGQVSLRQGTLWMRGDYGVSDIQAIDLQGGTIRLDANDLNLDGQTLTLNEAVDWDFDGLVRQGVVQTELGTRAVLNGGRLETLTLSGPSEYRVVSSVLDEVTLDGVQLSLDGGLRLTQAGLAGSGSIRFDNEFGPSSISAVDRNAPPPTIASDIEIHTGAGNGVINGVTTNGRILIDQADRYIEMRDGWRNQGVVDLQAGEWRLGGEFTPDDIGTVNGTGGRVLIQGQLDLDQSVFDLASINAPVVFEDDAYLFNGTIQNSSGPLALISSGQGNFHDITFDQLVVDADVQVAGGVTLNLRGENVFSPGRVITLGGADLDGVGGDQRGRLEIYRDAIVTGPGKVRFTGVGGELVLGGDSLDDPMSISGLTFVNESNYAHIDGGRFDGTFVTTGDDAITEFRERALLDGSFAVSDGGLVNMYFDRFGLLPGGEIRVENGGTLRLNRIDDLDQPTGRILLDGGDVRFTPGASLAMLDVVDYNSGTLAFDGLFINMQGEDLNVDGLPPFTIYNSRLANGSISGDSAALFAEDATFEGINLTADVGVRDSLVLQSYTGSGYTPTTVVGSRFYHAGSPESSSHVALGARTVIQDVVSEIDLNLPDGDSATLIGTLTLQGDARLQAGSRSTLGLSGDTSINGGQINVATFKSLELNGDGSGTLNLNTDIVVAESASLTSSQLDDVFFNGALINNGGDVELLADRLILLGDVDLNGGLTELGGSTLMTNAGSITLGGGADLAVQGTHDARFVESIQRDGQGRIILDGYLSNLGGTLTLDEDTQDVWLDGTIGNGRVESTDGQKFYLQVDTSLPGATGSGSGSLSGVTLAADVELQYTGQFATLNFSDGLTLDGSTITNHRGRLQSSDGSGITGNGTIVLSGYDSRLQGRNTLMLERIGSGITVNLAEDTYAKLGVNKLLGRIEVIGTDRYGVIGVQDNQGAILIGDGGFAVMDLTNFENNGTLELDNGALMIRNAETTDFQGTGTFTRRNSGRVYLNGFWFLGDQTATADSFGGDWQFAGGVVRGGTIDLGQGYLTTVLDPELNHGNTSPFFPNQTGSSNNVLMLGAQLIGNLNLGTDTSFYVDPSASITSDTWLLEKDSRLRLSQEQVDGVDVHLNSAFIQGDGATFHFTADTTLAATGNSGIDTARWQHDGHFDLDGSFELDVNEVIFSSTSSLSLAGQLTVPGASPVVWSNQTLLQVKANQNLAIGPIVGELGRVDIGGGLEVGGTYDLNHGIAVAEGQHLVLFDQWSASVAPVIDGGALGIDDQPEPGQAKTLVHADSLIADWSVSDATAYVIFNTTLTDALSLDPTRYREIAPYAGLNGEGSVDLEGQTLNLDSTPFEWTLAGGTYRNGRLVSSSQAVLRSVHGEWSRLNDIELSGITLDAGDSEVALTNIQLIDSVITTQSTTPVPITLNGTIYLEDVTFDASASLTYNWLHSSSSLRGDIELNGDLYASRNLEFLGHTDITGQGRVLVPGRQWQLNGHTVEIHKNVEVQFASSNSIVGFGAELINHGRISFEAGSSTGLSVDRLENRGQLLMSGYDVQTSSQITNTSQGLLEVSSRITGLNGGTLVNEGQLLTGGAIGVKFFDLPLTLTQESSLALRIASDHETDGYDQIYLTGFAELAGELQLNFVDAMFAAETGQTFDLIHWEADAAITGEFNSVVARDGLGQRWTVELLYGEAMISAMIVDQLIAGDFNGNGAVDAADYTVWQDNFGSTTRLAADANDNGIIDAADYTVWQDNFGATSTARLSLTNTPEPGTLALLILSFPAFMRRRRTVA